MTTDPAVTAAVTRACPWHHRTDCGCRETQVPELVWTVAVAIHALRGYGKPPVCPDCIADAEAAVAAARPIIEAEFIEKMRHAPHGWYPFGWHTNGGHIGRPVSSTSSGPCDAQADWNGRESVRRRA